MKNITPYRIFESEDNLIKLYHGGNLELFDYTIQNSKSAKRAAYGPGLYLTSDEDVARSYAKGSRKLYTVYLEPGTDMGDMMISWQEIYDFLELFYASSSMKKVMKHFERAFEKMGEEIHMSSFDAIVNNEKLIKPSKSAELIKFYISKGVDYYLDENTFGWNEKTYIVYNLKKIKHIQRM